MAFDERLLDETAELTWSRAVPWAAAGVSAWASSRSWLPSPRPPCGRRLDVVRRPCGGRAVLHGEGFEWSFAVVCAGRARSRPLSARRRAVRAGARRHGGGAARAAACRSTRRATSPTALGVVLRSRVAARPAGGAARRSSPWRRRSAAARTSCTAACSSGGRRPSWSRPSRRRVGEPWQGDGLAAGGVAPDGAALWRASCASGGASWRSRWTA